MSIISIVIEWNMATYCLYCNEPYSSYRAVYVGIDIIIIYYAIRLKGRLHDKSLKIT